MSMTLEEAITILNELGHRGLPYWEISQSTGRPQDICVTGPDPHSDFLTPMEAIAIAEAYARKRKEP